MSSNSSRSISESESGGPFAVGGSIPPSRFHALQSRMHTPPPRPIPSESRPTSTPISNKVSGSQPYSSSVYLQDEENRRRLAGETKRLFLGPMPCSQFLAQFLPLASDAGACPKFKGAFRDVPLAISEKAMYTPFIDAAEKFCPNLRFCNTSNHPDSMCDGLKPDIGVYSADTETNRETDFSKMEMWLEFKHDASADGFRDPEELLDPDANGHHFEHDSDSSTLTRGQLASYAAAHMGTQFRTHAFSVLICGTFARLIRWDRAGAIVSRTFDYTQRPEPLAKFLWQFNHLSSEGRGSDTSASQPNPDEVENVRKHLGSNCTFTKLSIPSAHDTSEGHYIVPSPKYTSRSPFGRATRPSRAYDIERDKIVFCKDYWRIDQPGMRKEGDIYALLEKHQVPHIAPFDRGNDVRNHTTVTQTLRGENWACNTKEMPCYKHYRMSLDIVGRELVNFDSSWEFVNAIADGMEAHQFAFERAKILHRDISVGNIIITDAQEGLLIDWDLSVDVDILNASPRRPERTGTWQFISANLLFDIDKRHTLQDDLESSLHVLIWTALRFTANDRTPTQNYRLLQMFDEAFSTDQGTNGGRLKERSMTSREIPRLVKFKSRPALDQLVRDLTDTLSVRYEEPPTDQEMEVYHEAQNNPVVPFAVLSISVPFKYQTRMNKLASSTWLVKTFRKHLADRESWPRADKAVPQVVDTGRYTSDKKRTGDQAGMESNVPSLGKVVKRDDGRLPGGSGSSVQG